MKQKILLLLVASGCILSANAQKKNKPVTAYAITSEEKGNSRWTEVRLIDVKTGEEIETIYKSAEEVPVLNARTGKPIKKTEVAKQGGKDHEVVVFKTRDKKSLTEEEIKELVANRKVEGVDQVIITDGKQIELSPSRKPAAERVIISRVQPTQQSTEERKTVNYVVMRKSFRINSDAPFATQSAACAYDKKNDRLYYTPMGINQLRYIDLKSKTPQVYFFEDEAFGVLSGPGDVRNQITRMVIASDGNGYALTNNAEHLIRFTTNKKAVITDLGTLTDDASNKVSIHSGSGYGGDMIADKAGNLYLITANRSVFKINIETRVAVFQGTIKGLPRGFTTNGAVVENGSNIVVTSSTATSGYYMFSLDDLQAKKVSAAETVFNASDLANGNLLAVDKKKKEEPKQETEVVVEEQVAVADPAKQIGQETAASKLVVFPNPVTNGIVKLSFNDYAAGKYDVQIFDLNGKMVASENITLNSKTQIQEVRLPSVIASGNYLVKVISQSGKMMSTEKFIVQ